MSASYFQNVLMATDFSDCARAGLETAVSLARKFGGKLTFAHAVRDVPAAFATFDYGTGWQITPEELDRLQAELREDAARRLQELVAEHRAAGVELATETLVGLPYLAINEAVKQHNFDLVVVGTRGMGAIKRVLVGSTATRLARLCPVPVWIARCGLPDATQSILVPLDFSPIGERLLSVAAALASTLGAKLHLLHAYDVEELYGVPPLSEDTRAELSHYRRYARRAALEKLEQSLETLGLGHGTATLHVTQGVSHQVINATARKLDVGLIVMGSVGRRGISGLLIGNTAEKVLHTSDRSLLVVKPPEFVKVAAKELGGATSVEVQEPVLSGG
ncbi:MAG TPA: universal stress protein [Pirellulales bacterium]|nr:universal stress protein [Pirellulales bacterium]